MFKRHVLFFLFGVSSIVVTSSAYACTGCCCCSECTLATTNAGAMETAQSTSMSDVTEKNFNSLNPESNISIIINSYVAKGESETDSFNSIASILASRISENTKVLLNIKDSIIKRREQGEILKKATEKTGIGGMLGLSSVCSNARTGMRVKKALDRFKPVDESINTQKDNQVFEEGITEKSLKTEISADFLCTSENCMSEEAVKAVSKGMKVIAYGDGFILRNSDLSKSDNLYAKGLYKLYKSRQDAIYETLAYARKKVYETEALWSGSSHIELDGKNAYEAYNTMNAFELKRALIYALSKRNALYLDEVKIKTRHATFKAMMHGDVMSAKHNKRLHRLKMGIYSTRGSQ